MGFSTGLSNYSTSYLSSIWCLCFFIFSGGLFGTLLWLLLDDYSFNKLYLREKNGFWKNKWRMENDLKVKSWFVKKRDLEPYWKVTKRGSRRGYSPTLDNEKGVVYIVGFLYKFNFIRRYSRNWYKDVRYMQFWIDLRPIMSEFSHKWRGL